MHADLCINLFCAVHPDWLNVLGVHAINSGDSWFAVTTTGARPCWYRSTPHPSTYFLPCHLFMSKCVAYFYFFSNGTPVKYKVLIHGSVLHKTCNIFTNASRNNFKALLTCMLGSVYIMRECCLQKTMLVNHDLVNTFSKVLETLNPQNLGYFIESYIR